MKAETTRKRIKRRRRDDVKSPGREAEDSSDEWTEEKAEDRKIERGEEWALGPEGDVGEGSAEC